MTTILLILGLIYMILFYAALPLGVLALAFGGFQFFKTRNHPEGRTPRVLTAKEIEDGQTAQSPYDDAIGFIWIGVVLTVIGGAINAHQFFGI